MIASRVQVIDSHTGGEPTRVVVSGGPELGGGSVAERLAVLRERHADFMRAVLNEPRGSEVLVGALLVEPHDTSCAFGAIFFDNAGCIGMCGHGTIGLIVTLAHLGRIGVGEHRIETAVGIVSATLRPDGSVSVTNVASFRKATTAIDVPGVGRVSGDVAYGGNWFFLVEEHGQRLELSNVEALTDFAWRLRLAVNAQGFPEIDHVILYEGARNFVLCPGKAYDRSPCGTGTSARLACLAVDGRLGEGDVLVQESIVGSTFTASYRWLDRTAGTIAPTITGTAFITAEATLCFDEGDPFRHGIPSSR
ncbi:MAG: proline racemase family protein [Chthoniobacteraceae bacterium]